jgi:hypothetical protein
MDNIRLKFISGQQKKFLEEVSKKSGLPSKELAKIAEVHSHSFGDWKREKLTMTLNAAEKFTSLFNVHLPENRQVLILRWQNARKNANKIGGLAMFKKYGSPGTAEGRRKGGIKAITNLRKNGIIPKVKIYKLPAVFSKKLAEYVGILLGDGCITPGQCNVTLNSVADCEYVPFVARLGKYLFGEEPKLYRRKDSKALVLYYNGRSMIRYLLSIGLKIGDKVRQQVDVPNWIKSYLPYKIACVRGLMDTDGGVFLHKYKVNGKEYFYKKICFSNKSIPLLIFVKKTLKELGFNPKIVNNVVNKQVWLYNNTEVKDYLKKIGTSNPRLLRLGG